MKLSNQTIKFLGKIVTGDAEVSPYRSGPVLVDLFNEFGFGDTYGQGFPSRWQYAETKLSELNDSSQIGKLICRVLDPREFFISSFDESAAVENLNRWLAYDGYKVVIDGGVAKIHQLKGETVTMKNRFDSSNEESHRFIEEQINKSELKIASGDFDGAITNARSLLESVLVELENSLDGNASSYDGEVLKLFKRVQRLLNLEPGRPDISGPLRQVLTGLVSIVGGVAGISNKMGDRHARTYKPSMHHAVLVVNATKTLVDFLFETRKHQSRLAPQNTTGQS